jgi:hypothetical protein
VFTLCPDDIGVILTYRCQSRCAHCIYNCGPITEGYTGRCLLCVDVRRHLVKSGEFDELRPQGFYENL